MNGFMNLLIYKLYEEDPSIKSSSMNMEVMCV